MAITLKNLQVMEYQLTARDRAILTLLRDAKSLFTYHIRRALFADAVNTQAAARATNRNMKKLRDLGLVDVLVDRRIGGIRPGSSSYIWYLTEQGSRVLNLDQKYDETRPKRTRFLEPATSTLGHRMAINECYVQLLEIARTEENFQVREALFEPANWHYFYFKGKQEILKPDLTAVVAHHNNEYRFMIEMDLSTESVDTIVTKCFRYHKYLETGIEQEKYGVFPLVLFIVKDKKRLYRCVEEVKRRIKNLPQIFLFITPDQFKSTITSPSIPQDTLC